MTARHDRAELPGATPMNSPTPPPSVTPQRLSQVYGTSALLTPEAQAGRGARELNDLSVALMYLHDALVLAEQNAMDVCMMFGTLRSLVFDQLYRDVTHEGFSDTIRRILLGKRSVRILVGNQKQEGLISPEIHALVNEVGGRSDLGSLDIRISGTSRYSEAQLCHFAIARNMSRDKSVLWLEAPHRPHEIHEQISSIHNVETYFGVGVPDAEAHVAAIWPVFDELFEGPAQRGTIIWAQDAA